MFIIRWRLRIKQLLLMSPISNGGPEESHENTIERFAGKQTTIFVFNSGKSKVSNGKHLETNKNPNSVEARGLIFHVEISIVNKDSSRKT